jgi:UDP-glucose 4-epimerase
MARVLCTGGAGFIGSHLVDRLIEEGHHVAVLDDLSGGNIENMNPKANYLTVDLRDAQRTDVVIKHFHPEVVFHLAANAAENKAQFSPIDVTSRNYSAFINTLTPFIKYGGKRFVFTSSIAVYGALQTPFKETDKPEPEDLYGITKLAAEQTLKVMSEVHGFEYVIARPHNVYGPRQNMRDPYRNVVTIWMNAILRGEPYCIYGDGWQKRCFSYVDDVVEALYKCGFENVANMTFNIGSDSQRTLNDLDTAMRTITGWGGNTNHLDTRVQEVKEAVANHEQAKKSLNYVEKTALMDGLKETWEWVKEQGPQEPIYTELEIDSDKVPQNWKKDGR